MNRSEICSRVIETAERFGATNPQQISLLESQLSKSPSEEICFGLLAVFAPTYPEGKRFQHQELAGRLLVALKPPCSFDLEGVVRTILPAYNRSIEQLPQYLVHTHGAPEVLKALSKIEAEGINDIEQANLSTIRWWISGMTNA